MGSDFELDTCANIGLTAIFFSIMAKQTFAFEPNSSTFNIMSRNLTTNHINNVRKTNNKI